MASWRSSRKDASGRDRLPFCSCLAVNTSLPWAIEIFFLPSVGQVQQLQAVGSNPSPCCSFAESLSLIIWLSRLPRRAEFPAPARGVFFLFLLIIARLHVRAKFPTPSWSFIYLFLTICFTCQVRAEFPAPFGVFGYIHVSA